MRTDEKLNEIKERILKVLGPSPIDDLSSSLPPTSPFSNREKGFVIKIPKYGEDRTFFIFFLYKLPEDLKEFWNIVYSFFRIVKGKKYETRKYFEVHHAMLIISQMNEKNSMFDMLKRLFSGNVFSVREIEEKKDEELLELLRKDLYEFKLFQESFFPSQSIELTANLLNLMCYPKKIREAIFEFARAENVEKIEAEKREILEKSGLFIKRETLSGEWIKPTTSIVGLVRWIRETKELFPNFENMERMIQLLGREKQIKSLIEKLENDEKIAKKLKRVVIGGMSRVNFLDFIVEDFLIKLGIPFEGFPEVKIPVLHCFSDLIKQRKQTKVLFDFRIEDREKNEILILTKVVSRPLLPTLPELAGRLLSTLFFFDKEKETLVLNEKRKIILFIDSPTFGRGGDPLYWFNVLNLGIEVHSPQKLPFEQWELFRRLNLLK